MTWLLVEDDNDIRNVVAVMMSVWGEKPLSFADGNAAWAWIDSVANGTFSGELPDLALMDIRMPGYTGDKVAARIRQTPAIKDIPIILMTAFSLSEAEVQTMIEQAGIDHLINKPLPDMEVFRSTLYRVRDERRARLASRAEQAKPGTESAAQQAAKAAEPVKPTQQGPSQATPPQPVKTAEQQASSPQTPAQPPAAKPTEPAKPGQQPTTQQPPTQQVAASTTPSQPTPQPPAKSADQQPPTKPTEPATQPSEKASEKETK